MKKITFLLAAICVVGIIVSCQTETQTQKVAEIVVDINMPALSDSLMVKRFTNGRFVVLKGARIGEIDRLLSWKDRYVIFDKQQQAVSIFDSTGNVVKQIRRVGRGPGEYIQIQDCAIDNENDILMIYADQPGKILFFDYNGQYLREFELKNCFYEISSLGGKVFGYNCSPQKEEGCLIKEFTIPDFAKSENKAHSDKKSIDFNSGKRLFSDSKQVWMSPAGQPYIYLYDSGANDFAVKYSINYGPNQIPDDFDLNKEDPMAIISNAMKNKIILHSGDICKVGNYLLFKAHNNSFMLDVQSNEVAKIGAMAAPSGVKAILSSPSYIPFDNQNSRYATRVPASLLMVCGEKMASKTMALDEAVLELSRQNAEFANPVLMIYDVIN